MGSGASGIPPAITPAPTRMLTTMAAPFSPSTMPTTAPLSNPPASEQPGGGAQCGISQSDAAAICPGFTATGSYPANCANFNQLGFRVPFIAVSPFAKPHYVSHTVGDHTSLLALIEKRFLSLPDQVTRPHLTARDLSAATLEDLFDFSGAPSMHTSIPAAPSPSASNPGCSRFDAPMTRRSGGSGQ